MRYNSITTCDICNGLGIGVILWCQGCELHCPGCHNKETWDFNGGTPFSQKTKDLILAELDKPYIDRLTLSGGHPLAKDNLNEMTAFCKQVKEKYPNKTIWVYTGLHFEDIKSYEILRYINVLVDGPFVQEERDITLAFRGSRNQRIIDVPKSLQAKKTILLEVQ